jgi:uncharacterized delta-60 repeat protein
MPRTHRIASVTVAIAVLTIAAAVPGRAGGGDLDRTFSGDGIVTTFGAGSRATAVAIDHDGRIVVAGYTLRHGVDVAVARLLPGGAPDTTFGHDGRVRVDLGGADYAFDVAVLPDDGLAIAGQRTTSHGTKGFVLRLGRRGLPWAAFGGGDGTVFVGFGKPYQALNSIAISARGRIVVGGYTSNGSATRSALARLLPGGHFDAGFSGNGRLTLDVSPGAEQINDLVPGGDGRILAAGYAEAGLQPRFLVLRVLRRGTLDRGFGTDHGVTLTDLGAGADVANAVTLQPDGRIVVAGGAAAGRLGDWGIARYRVGGRLDPSFGRHGIRLVRGNDQPEQAEDVAAWGRRLVVAGILDGPSGGADIGVVRLRAGGALDGSFGGDGRIRLDLAGGADEATGVAVPSNGRVVVGGTGEWSGTFRMVVLRLLRG